MWPHKHSRCPATTTFQTLLPDLHNKQRARFEAELREIEHFSATSDLSSSRTMEPYLSMTVNSIAPDFTIKSRCLQTAFFPEDQTGVALAQGLKDALSSGSLKEDKLICITTDNGQNIVKAISLNDWTRLQCFGHRLHLAIGELLYKVSTTKKN